jgi:hypothetical protein
MHYIPRTKKKINKKFCSTSTHIHTEITYHTSKEEEEERNMAARNTPNTCNGKELPCNRRGKETETEPGTVFFNALSHETKGKERRKEWG